VKLNSSLKNILSLQQVARSTVAPTLKNVSMSMLTLSPDAALEVVKFLRECLFVAHPQMAPLLLLEGEAEEDGAILPAAAVSLPTSGERDPFGISSGQSLMWEASLIADHVSPAVVEASQDLLGKRPLFCLNCSSILKGSLKSSKLLRIGL
jgi:hypothetical protein